MIKNKLIDIVALFIVALLVLGSLYVYNQISAHAALDAQLIEFIKQLQAQVAQAPK